MPIYAIGDIHGQRELLLAAHEKIASDRARYGSPEDEVVHLGDLVDRGPDSKGVLDYLRQGQAAGEPWIVLKGNHDRMFELYMETPPKTDPILKKGYTWLDPKIGGSETLRSYGLSRGLLQTQAAFHRAAQEVVPQEHLDYLAALPLMHRVGDVVFVHAGIRPGVPLDSQVEHDLIWIREGFLDDDSDFGALIVHGHTVVDEPTHCGNRIDLDTGAGYGRPLTTAVFEGRKAWVLTEDGRVPLDPV